MTLGTMMVAARLFLGAVGMTAARHDEKPRGVTPLAVREIAERLDGKETNATAVEVTFEPGQAGAPHRHPGPAFGFPRQEVEVTIKPDCNKTAPPVRPWCRTASGDRSRDLRGSYQ